MASIQDVRRRRILREVVVRPASRAVVYLVALLGHAGLVLLHGAEPASWEMQPCLSLSTCCCGPSGQLSSCTAGSPQSGDYCGNTGVLEQAEPWAVMTLGSEHIMSETHGHISVLPQWQSSFKLHSQGLGLVIGNWPSKPNFASIWNWQTQVPLFLFFLLLFFFLSSWFFVCSFVRCVCFWGRVSLHGHGCPKTPLWLPAWPWTNRN